MEETPAHVQELRPAAPRKKSLARRAAGMVIYLAVLVGVVVGLPRGLSYVLKTPYPLAAITSGSMWPNLKEGDLVLILGYQGDPREVAVGDIIVFRNPTGTFTIHRIVLKNDKTVTTKGDANFEPDKPVKYKDIIGKAVALGDKPVRLPLIGSISVIANNLKNDRR